MSWQFLENYLKAVFRAVAPYLPFEVRRKRPARPLEVRRYAYQSKYVPFDIGPGERVLDVGSGHDPFPLATILGDRFLQTTVHRAVPLVRDSRPLVALDVQGLPFPDKSFDFVYCSHVLEHVPEPERACGELMRIGRRGYIETPTLGKDTLFGWEHEMHRWHVVAHVNELHFFECTDKQRKGVHSDAWRKAILGDKYSPMQDLFWGSQDVFNVMFLWNDSFECHVHRLPEKGRVP